MCYQRLNIPGNSKNMHCGIIFDTPYRMTQSTKGAHRVFRDQQPYNKNLFRPSSN